MRIHSCISSYFKDTFYLFVCYIVFVCVYFGCVVGLLDLSCFRQIQIHCHCEVLFKHVFTGRNRGLDCDGV